MFNQCSSAAQNKLCGSWKVIDQFTNLVLAESGGAVPDWWKKGTAAPNAAGALRVAAGTLRFSILFKKTNHL